MSVDIAERVSCGGSQFIVSVIRTDDIKEDSGELIAEKVSNIVFDFKVDRDAESLLINGYALKLVPQHVQKVTFFAAVLPPDHPVLSSPHQNPHHNPHHNSNSPAVASGHGPSSLSVKSPDVVEALNKLDRNGLVTADVDLFVVYEGDKRQLAIRVQVVELAGKQVSHKDLLIAQITLPQHHRFPGTYSETARIKTLEDGGCVTGDWKCRVGNWLKSLSGCGKKGIFGGRPHPAGRPGGGHPGAGGFNQRHRFHKRPGHGLRKFMISVVIPILIGAAAGVGIGVLSVFIAELVGGIVMRIRGRRSNAPEYIEIVDTKEPIEQVEEEDVEEPLPVYQPMSFDAVPEYTDSEEKHR